MLKIRLTVFISMMTALLHAQSSDSTDHNGKIKFLALPTLGYAPETKAYLGAVCLATQKIRSDSFTRISSMKTEFTFTQRKQIIAEFSWLTFGKTGKIISTGKLQGARYPDYFWGAGNNSSSDSRVTFNSSRWNAEASLLFRLSSKKSLYLGPALRFRQYSQIDYITGDSASFNQLTHALRYSPAGVTLILDQRNNPLNATSGKYILITSGYTTGNQLHYFKHTADIRAYKSVKKMVFAGRVKAVSSGGNVMDAAYFGGDESARGFYYGRYIVGAFATAQAEMRWFFSKRWGLAFFGGTSLLGYDAGHREREVYNAGSGLRFLIDRESKINLRFDYAVGSSGNSGFYIAFGESF